MEVVIGYLYGYWRYADLSLLSVSHNSRGKGYERAVDSGPEGGWMFSILLRSAVDCETDDFSYGDISHVHDITTEELS